MASSRKRWALAALALTTLTVGLDGTVLSVALPTLAADLGATTSDLQWFTTVYLLVLAAALLPAGMLGDRFGRKRLLLMALGLFGAASVCCAYATSSGQLVLARAVLGLGAAVLMPLTSAVLTVLFEAGERARALSVWVTASALGIPLGPLVGGWLLDNFWWGSVFLINVPMVLLAGIAVALLVPESHGDRTRRFDPVGVLLSAAGLVTLTYGIIDAGERGWTAARPLTLVAAGVALLVVFATWQRRAAAPLVDLALFSSRGFTWGAILAMVPNIAMFGLLFSLPQLFQAVQGADALGTGLRLLPVIGGLMAGARVAGRIPNARRAVTAGLAVMAVALLAGAAADAHTGYGWIAAWITAAGFGMGLAMPPAMNAALGALSPERSGVGSGLIQAMRQVGGAVGVAVLGAELNDGYRSALSGAPAAARESVSAGVAWAKGPAQDAFAQGMTRSLLVAAGFAAAGAVLAAVALPRVPKTPELAESQHDHIPAERVA